MNSRISGHNPSAAEEQASLWAAKLDGSTLSAAERRALDAWLDAHPSHRALLASYCQLSTDLEQQVPLLAGLKDLPVEESSAQATARPFPWSSRPLWVGAMLTAAAAVALVFWSGRTEPVTVVEAPLAAQRQALALADGTQIEVDARTQLDVRIGRDERRARLAGGQAFFAVARDAQRPFIVETPAGTVQVTGTQFNVRTEPPGVLEVTVVEGSVTIRPADAAPQDRPVILVAGTRYASGLVGTAAARQLEAALAWRRGQAVFDDVPLSEALLHVARRHGRTITASAAAAAERVGGRFSIDDLEDFLTTLEAAIGVETERQPDGTILVRKAGER